MGVGYRSNFEWSWGVVRNALFMNELDSVLDHSKSGVDVEGVRYLTVPRKPKVRVQCSLTLWTFL